MFVKFDLFKRSSCASNDNTTIRISRSFKLSHNWRKGKWWGRISDLRKCFQSDNMEEKETGRAGDGQTDREGGRRRWNDLSRGGPREELDWVPLASVTVKANWPKNPYTAPRTQLRSIVVCWRIFMSEKKNYIKRRAMVWATGSSACQSREGWER